MTKKLIIYDETGYLLSIRQDEPAPREPIGVPFLWADIPLGKILTGVDVTTTPHQPILEDIPPTEIEQLKQTVADLTEIVLMGGM